MTLRLAPSAPAATERDTVAAGAVRAGAHDVAPRGSVDPVSPTARRTHLPSRDESRLTDTATSAPARTTDPFYDGLAVILEGSIRGLVGEYRGDLRAGSGHRPCDRCGCIGVVAR